MHTFTQLRTPGCYPINARRILIVAPSWVGDMVMAQSLFMVVKARFPESHLTVLAPRQTLPLAARMPEIDAAFELPFQHREFKPLQRFLFGRRLREHQFDWCIVLPNSFKSALIPYWAAIPVRTGYRGEMRNSILTDVRTRSGLPLHVQRCNALALPAGTEEVPIPHPRLQVGVDVLDQVLERERLRGDKPIMALCPGAEYGPSKRWPIANFAELARSRVTAGWQVWALGGPSDQLLIESLCRLAGPGCINLAGKTNLIEAIDLLSLARLVVTNDSGLMHIAAALGRRIVAIYGSTTPDNTPPLTDKATLLAKKLHCRPCYARVCRYGHYECLHSVSTQDVLYAIDKNLLEADAAVG